MSEFTRILTVRPGESFFLWGPRQTGKTWYLRARFADAFWVDLLKTDQFRKYATAPHLLREELDAAATRPSMVVIDEIQRVPALLDEVHWLIENRGLCFGLCGSSARKIRRGHANLLGGRAVRHELRGLVSAELGAEFDLVRLLNHGYFPRIYRSESHRRLQGAYADDYLAQEIAHEGLVRNLPAFADFLRIAALGDAEIVSYSTIARECGVSNVTVQNYYRILIDTLLGSYLPAFTRRPKRRVVHAPKFFLADVGIVNHVARRGAVEPGSALWGKAFENWVHHELRAYSAYREKDWELSYWRLSSGVEVDFVINDMEAALEAKGGARIGPDHLKGLRELRKDHPRVKKLVLVSMEETRRQTEDGIQVLSARDFADRLWAGELV